MAEPKRTKNDRTSKMDEVRKENALLKVLMLNICVHFSLFDFDNT